MFQSIEPTQQVNGLLTGEFDFLAGVPAEDLDRVEDAGFALSVKSTNSLGFIYLNPNLEPWGNIHLRLALNYAVDRDKYVEVVYENLNPANHWGYLGPALAGIHDPDEILIRYDPDRVREELALAGMPDGFAFDMNVPVNGVTGRIRPGQLRAVRNRAEHHRAPGARLLHRVLRAAGLGVPERHERPRRPWQQIAFLGRAEGPYDSSCRPATRTPRCRPRSRR